MSGTLCSGCVSSWCRATNRVSLTLQIFCQAYFGSSCQRCHPHRRWLGTNACEHAPYEARSSAVRKGACMKRLVSKFALFTNWSRGLVVKFSSLFHHRNASRKLALRLTARNLQSLQKQSTETFRIAASSTGKTQH